MARDTNTGPGASPAKWRCPMCAEPNVRTKEHVWPQWLREHPCVKSELEHWHGERAEWPQPITTLGNDGCYRTELGSVESVARFLPQVTVPVCDPCNTGWMSRLETEVKTLLGPWVYDAQPVRLRPEHQRTISTWAVKTFMTYAFTLPPQSNPFTAEEYAELVRTQTAPSRAHIWMYASTSVRSAVGVGINPYTLSDGSFDPVTEADNAALGFLAAGHAMFLMVLVPETAPEALVQASSPPPARRPALMQRITKPKKGWLFPTGTCDERHMDAVMAWMDLPERTGLPFEGLTPQEKQQSGKSFLEGVSLDELRTDYSNRVIPSAPLRAQLTASQRNARRDAKRLQRRGQHQDAAQGLLEAADLHSEAKDWQSALDLLEEALAIEGTSLSVNANVVSARGVCLTQLGRWPEAAVEHQRAIDLGRDTQEGRGDLAYAWSNCGKYAQALDLLEAPQPDPDVPELPRSELTREALAHLVYELGVTEQDRQAAVTLPDGLDVLSEEEIRGLQVTLDALAPELWARRDNTENTIAFHVARAWWGGQVHDWFVTAALLHHHGFTEQARYLVRFGFELSTEMVEAHEQFLVTMRTAGAPDVEELTAVWSDEAERVRGRLKGSPRIPTTTRDPPRTL